MGTTLFLYYFEFKDSEGNIYELREADLTQVFVKYRLHGSSDSFTEIYDYNIDESNSNRIWVRLPALGEVDININISVAPLRTITTGLQTLTLDTYTPGFTMTSTPVPIYSLQGYSPRVIDGYWYQFNDELQTFENTGIPATGTLIESGQVDDFAESGDMNAITSNAVYNIKSDVDSSITSINNSITDIESQVSSLESKEVSVTVNSERHTQDLTGNIDLGTISGVPDTTMLTDLTEINGTLYPKGTQIDEDNRVYSTDSNYYYRFTTAKDSASDDYNYMIAAVISDPCRLDVKYSVYNTDRYGSIWINRNGYVWSYYTTTKELAEDIFIYRPNLAAAPRLCFYATSPYMPATVNIVSDKALSITRTFISLEDTSLLSNIKPFLTDESNDQVVISVDEYAVSSLEDMKVTNYVVASPSGSLNYLIESEEVTDTTFSLTFNMTADGTVTVSDPISGVTTFESTSPELSAGDVAAFVFDSPENVHWTVSHTTAALLTDVQLDDESVVVSTVARLTTLTGDELDSLKAIFS